MSQQACPGAALGWVGAPIPERKFSHHPQGCPPTARARVMPPDPACLQLPAPCMLPAGSTWQAGALAGGVPWAAGAPVLAGGGPARAIGQLAVGAGGGGAADAAVGADLVEAGAAMVAEPGALAALVDVLPARGAVEAGRAVADIRRLKGQALATAGHRVGGAGVALLGTSSLGEQGAGGWLAGLLVPMSWRQPRPGVGHGPSGISPHHPGTPTT